MSSSQPRIPSLRPVEHRRAFEGISVTRGSDHGASLRTEPVNPLSHHFQLQLSLRHVSVESLVTSSRPAAEHREILTRPISGEGRAAATAMECHITALIGVAR